MGFLLKGFWGAGFFQIGIRFWRICGPLEVKALGLSGRLRLQVFKTGWLQAFMVKAFKGL